MVPAWVWELTGSEPASVTAPVSPVFLTRADAEIWLGQHWRYLRDRQVRAARLVHEGRPWGAAFPLVSRLTD